jgi:hypothetical protein
MQLAELHDQSWFPRVFRDGLTDALQAVLNLGAVYGAIAPRLGRAIAASGAERVVDLCSGRGPRGGVAPGGRGAWGVAAAIGSIEGRRGG